MLPPPDDPVLTQLQALLNQCHHGNNYCRQILSLYQLSKVHANSSANGC